jgi:hypothetical protein
MPRQTLPQASFKILLLQWQVLVQRNLQVFLADKSNLALTVLQVPLIALLIIGAFYQFDRDKHRFDEAARVVYYFDLMKTPLEQADKAVNIDKLYKYAQFLAHEPNENLKMDYINQQISPYFAAKNVTLPNIVITFHPPASPLPISDLASVRRGSIYFLLVAASIWFGIMASCKEVVTEQPILKREIRSYLFIFPYLAAKFGVLILILGIQTGLLAIMVVPLLLKLSWFHTGGIGLILWITAAAAAALGLFISCIVRSYRVALTLVPLLMVPQLLFGGLLRPPVDIAPTNNWLMVTNTLSALTIQRWAFEAILTTDIYANGGILKLQVNPKGRGELDLVRAINSSLVDSFFQPRKWGNFEVGYRWPPLLYLGSASILFLLGGYLALRWRFT